MGTATLKLNNRETGQEFTVRANYPDHAQDGHVDDVELHNAERALEVEIRRANQEHPELFLPANAQIRFSGQERVTTDEERFVGQAFDYYTDTPTGIIPNTARSVSDGWRNSVVQLLSPTTAISVGISSLPLRVDTLAISRVDNITRIHRLMRWASQARFIANPGDPDHNPGLYEMIIGSDNPNDISLIGLIRNDIVTQWSEANGYTQQSLFNAEGQIDPGLVREVRDFLGRTNPFPPPASARNHNNSPEETFRSRLEWEFVKYLVEPLENINNPTFVSHNARDFGVTEGTTGPGFTYRTELSPTEFSLLGAEMTRSQHWHTPRMREFNARQVAALLTIIRYFQYATGRLDPTL